MTMKMRIFAVSFYLEGNENSGFYAWQSATSPRAECGWGATVNEAVSNLCRLLSSGEFTKPVTRAKRINDETILRAYLLRARASEEMGCTCDACLDIIRGEIEDEG